MKHMTLIAALAAALVVNAEDTDCGAIVTTANVADTAKVENLTGANAGKATITINDNSGTAQAVTVYNAATMDTALAGKATTGDLADVALDIADLQTATNNLTSAKADKATTLAGYGITDASIEAGTITLGSETITPVTTETDPEWNAAKSGYVQTSRKVAGMALSSDVTLKNLSIVGASTTTYNGSAAASVNQTTVTQTSTTQGSTTGKNLTIAVASTSLDMGAYYVKIGTDGKPHLMLRQ